MKHAMKKIQTALTIVTLLVPTANAFAWGRVVGGVHPARPGAVWARPRPVAVHNVYVAHRGGCYGCGAGFAAVAGLAAGAIVGAAIASSAPPPVYAAPAPVVVEAPPPPVIVAAGPPIGAEVAALPPGCVTMNVNGATYYQCGPTWYQPYFGGNAVYYTVVPTP